MRIGRGRRDWEDGREDDRRTEGKEEEGMIDQRRRGKEENRRWIGREEYSIRR